MPECVHEPRPRRLCRHLVDRGPTSYQRRFSGVGFDHDAVCPVCAVVGEAPELVAVCEPCAREVLDPLDRGGFAGEPQLRVRASSLALRHERVLVRPLIPGNIRAIEPVGNTARALWLALTDDGRLHTVDLLAREVVCNTSAVDLAPIDRDEPISMIVAGAGRDLATITQNRGRHGVVVDTRSGDVVLRLDRLSDAHRVTRFPVAFLERAGALLLVHATAWNRLDVTNPRTGARLTERAFIAPAEPPHARPAHFLDYFHAPLVVSPDQRWIAEEGWHWHPYGTVQAWSVDRWLDENPYESEDGPSLRTLVGRDYGWDGPLAWTGPRELAVYGYGNDEEHLVPAALIFDVVSGDLVRQFAGPAGDFVVDRDLFTFSKERCVQAWDIATGERLLRDEETRPVRYHTGAHHFLTLDGETAILSFLTS